VNWEKQYEENFLITVAVVVVFIMGYPKSAIFSGIIEDEYHNKVDKDKFAKQNI